MVIHTAIHQSRSDPQVQFKATDHGDVILAGLTKLRDMELLFDVVLVVENEHLSAHRVVLASFSEYFRAMFTDGLLECHLSEIQLNGVTAKGMRHLIDFAYTSKIDIDAESVEDILSAANHVMLLPVVEACINYLQSHIEISNCVDMLNIAELFSLTDFLTFVYKYISRNFFIFSVSAELLHLSGSQLETLLHLNYPVNCAEIDVLSSVIGWLVHHYGYQAACTSKCLSKINFKSISRSDIEKMPNYKDFEKLLSVQEDVQTLKNILSEVKELSSIMVPGLINIRGYRESVVVCGGFRPDSGLCNNVEILDLLTGKLKLLTLIPHVQQCNFGLAVMNNCMYIVGGCYNDEHLEEIVHGFGFCYNPVTMLWDTIQPMINERCRFYLGNVFNKLYAIGGDPSASSEVGDYASCECYEPDSREWCIIAPLPGNRMEHAGTTLDHNLYISGGLQDLEGPVFNTFFRYDTTTDMWFQLPSMPTPRADHAMFAYDNKIYVIGGWYDHPVSQQRTMASTIDCFDLNKGQWQMVAEVPKPRLFATYTLHKGKVIITGGWLNGECKQRCCSLQIFDIASLEWTEIKSMTSSVGNVPHSVWEHGSCSLYVADV